MMPFPGIDDARTGGSTGRNLYNSEMQKATLRFGNGFKVILGNRSAQVATMTLTPGELEGSADNRHRGADQWLFVKAGSGAAIVNGRRHVLRTGTLILIERGDRHEIRNTGPGPLRTLNVYVPPAYAKSGHERPRGRK
jgi:mannose-6-phosphate isomerase-like protein (cupin superfamily)